jgi:glyoxylate reductase
VHESLRADLARFVLVTAKRTHDGVLEAAAGADYLIGDWMQELAIDGDLLDRATRCQAVFQPTAGTNVVDVEHAASLGIPVANAPGANARAVAEWVVMAILAMLKDVWRYHANVLAGKWEMLEAGRTGVYELGDRTVGIVGMGRIGQGVARRARGFDMRILDSRRDGLGTVLEHSDFVSLHVPLTPETHHLIDAGALARMKPTAILINTARGPIVDQHALREALIDGTIGGAALDVTDPEPLPADDPLLSAPNLIVAPHIGSATHAARERMAALAVENLLAALDGRPMPHQVR